MLRRTLFVILLLLTPVLLFAQADQLREGLLLFKQERYQDAIRAFRVLIFNARDDLDQNNLADAYYWISRAYLAIDNYDEAARNLEYYLTNFPEHVNYADGLYQKGRLLYLQGDPESGIQVLDDYLRRYPNSEYAGSAYFWLGECLFALGQMDEAARVFNKVIREYPKSVKLEASRYRLSLIEFKKREDELLRLLKWSHEEALKSVEEFKRRETAYEQAIDAYQRKLGSDSSAGPSALQALQSENDSLKKQIVALEAQIASMADGQTQEAGEAATERLQAFENREKALRIKAEALAVKEALLRSAAEQQEGSR